MKAKSYIRTIILPDPQVLAAEQAAAAERRTAIVDLIKRSPEVAAASFAECVRTSDPRAFEILQALRDENELRRGFEHLAKLRSVPDDARLSMRSVWAEKAHHLRRETRDDEVIAGALWNVLPPYIGQHVCLFRGEEWSDYVRGIRGFNWSSSREVAEMFAGGLNAGGSEGGALLSTIAPIESIISGPLQHWSVTSREFEYVVDPRRLCGVEVLARFPCIN